MPKHSSSAIDDVDAKIIEHLVRNARISLTELSAAIGLSAPSTSERMHRLAASGLLRSFTVDLNIAALGYTLEAIVRLSPVPGQLQRVEQMILAQPRFVTCDKVTGEDCFVARLALLSIGELDPILAKFHSYAATTTSFVHSTPIRRRLPPLPMEAKSRKGGTAKERPGRR